MAIDKVSIFCEKASELKTETDYFTDLLIKTLNMTGFKEIPGHELEHSFRVFELSLIIGCKLNASLRILAIASLLHDIGRFLENRSKVKHAEISADLARKVLISDRDRDFIISVITEHSYSAENKPSSIESAILQDADKIDALGFIGVARVFSYGGYNGRIMYNAICNRDKSSSLRHFYEKILKLDSLMNTNIGREIAVKRKEKVKLFIEELRREIDLQDILEILSSDINL